MDANTEAYLIQSNDFAQRCLGEDAEEVTIRTTSGNVLTLKASNIPRQSDDDRRSATRYVMSLLPDSSAKDGMPVEAIAKAGGYRNTVHVKRILRRLMSEKKVIKDNVGYKRATP